MIPIRGDSFVGPPFEVGCGLDEVGLIDEGGASPVECFGELIEGVERYVGDALVGERPEPRRARANTPPRSPQPDSAPRPSTKHPCQPPISRGRHIQNHKTYESINRNWYDPSGLICPFASPIRKTNPRDDPGIKSHGHRLIRRGIPFGASYPDPSDKGLLFLAYMTSIERQVEYVFKNWINCSDFPESDTGADPITGFDNDRSVPFTFKLRTNDGIIKEISINVPPDLVTITSGGYFFAPSIGALRFLAI